MKRPLLDQDERYTYLRSKEKGLDTGIVDWILAVAHLKQAFGKSWIIQRFIKPIVEHLSKALS